jgi:hypothetical protein
MSFEVKAKGNLIDHLCRRLQLLREERGGQADKQSMPDEAVDQRRSRDRAVRDRSERQHQQVHDCPHGSAIQQSHEHPVRTQCSDASARKDIDRCDYERDGEMQDEAKSRARKPA